ncbi:D-alanyl-D-alanine carboxypeptidase [Pelotomaculum isophthalicicum JI]|uniref:serine-type D-Ala-D-Ala carboxypeptidase n=1 Tax=Pelotomaculum isophthalicicum JI TaxID=947010 RepID=A0A9X4H8M1_9FIRM|nr:D-alanyl-D-alanine carboxypeptidase family protein [Pelotomaculum isophthalicicum]MDF9409049.1 D-alanyl-D-alanine carboxypeptidase [Pelotomaculum isophthalicicum JI]
MFILRKKALIGLMVFVLLAGLPVGQVAATASGTLGAENTAWEVAAPAVPETTAVAAVLLEPTTNKIIYEKEPNKRLPMASVTKLMTLLLASEAVEQGKFKLTDKVVTSENAWEMGGSQVYLEPGEEMSLWDMLLAIGLQSANDASVAVAEHIAGSEEAFVQAMNDKAKELGLANTNFVNCHGLTADNHYTSAYDMAVILKEGLKYPLFRQITSMKESELRGGAFKLWNTNKLLWWYNGADAGKTGWTEAAKYCLASSAERDGLRIICVVLGTPEPGSHFRESTKLLDYGFARYKAVKIAEQGANVGTIKVGKGQVDQVEAQTAEKVSVVALKGEEKGFESRVEVPDHLSAPVRKGQVVGAYVVTKGGQEVKRVNLVAGSDVLKATMIQQMKRVIDQVF